MAGRRRLILADITQSKLRGPALVKALGEMNKPTSDYATLASGVKKAKKSNKK